MAYGNWQVPRLQGLLLVFYTSGRFCVAGIGSRPLAEHCYFGSDDFDL